MKIKSFLRTALLVSTAIIAVSSNAADKIKIATEGAWAPFNFIDQSGNLKGFDVDIANALCEKMDSPCELVKQDWDGMIPALMVRKFDAIISSMSITEDRLKKVDFTDKYYSGGLRFMGSKSNKLDISKQSLKGKVIGAQRATIAGLHLENNYSDIAQVKLYDTQEAVYLDLVSGRLDVALSDELPTYDWLKGKDGASFEFKGDSFAKNDIIGIAVRKNDPVKQKLNAALAAIIADGTYADINAKYFPFSIY